MKLKFWENTEETVLRIERDIWGSIDFCLHVNDQYFFTRIELFE